jgi:hypothetical protein
VRAIIAALLVAISSSAYADEIVSAYTRLDLDKCRHKAGTMEEDYGAWTCRGLNGIPVHVIAGDQRSYVSYGRNAANEPAASQTLASFNGEGKTIEWRAIRGADGKLKPFATIMRWSTTVSDEDKTVRGQVLVVTRLGPPVCHVGYVDGRANPDANALAQDIADKQARYFKCGTDRPVRAGKTGTGFSAGAETSKVVN